MKTRTITQALRFRVVQQRKRKKEKSKYVVLYKEMMRIPTGVDPYWTITPTGRERKAGVFSSLAAAQAYVTISLLKNQVHF